MKKITTWYESSKLDKEAGGKEAVLAIAISLFLLPFDIAAIHWSRKFNKSPKEIEQVVTPEIKQKAWEVIEESKTNPEAAKFVESVKKEVADGVKADTVSTQKPQQVDLAVWANDIETVAKTLYGEASNQGHSGRMGVASVIWNRANGDKNRLKSVCLKPKQFSCWNDGVVNVDKKSKVWSECLEIAKSMFVGTFSPTTKGDHYYAFQGKYKVKSAPTWALNQTPVSTIGDHRFYDLL